jgi:death-on-curing protein
MGQGDGQEIAWLDILVDGVREVHEVMLEIGVGARGEHTASLYAACARPFQSAFGESIYNDAYKRAAAIFHSIICDHVFVDGNKRTATGVAVLVLTSADALGTGGNQADLKLALLGEVALATASGQLDVHEVAFWIRRIFGTA